MRCGGNNHEMDKIALETEYGLLASGTAGSWEVSIDESLRGEEAWLAEIDGPAVSFVFQLKSLSAVSEAIGFLAAGLDKQADSPKCPSASELTLGSFGDGPVQLVRDNEDFVRCFLVVESGNACLRAALLEDDIRMLCQALRQVSDGL